MRDPRDCDNPTRSQECSRCANATTSSADSPDMNRYQLEHVIRAAAGNANVRDIVVIGSQAVLGTHPDAPAQLRQSMEADVFPLDSPELSIVIDGAMGELSLFHETFGYYAHGVDESTAARRNITICPTCVNASEIGP